MNHVKRLEFEEKPDYNYYRSLFIDLLTRQGLLYDNIFDWMIPKKERLQYRKTIKRKFKSGPLKSKKEKALDKQLDSSNIEKTSLD